MSVNRPIENVNTEVEGSIFTSKDYLHQIFISSIFTLRDKTLREP